MNMKKTLCILYTALAFIYFLPFNVSAASFDTVVAFGDSLSDNGNLYNYDNSAFDPIYYYNGRFSNGPLWVEYLSGVTFAGVTTSGVTFLDCILESYAWGGAESSGTTPPGLIQQVEDYIVDLGGALSPPDTLITIWIGANDIRANFNVSVSSITGNIRKALDLLASSGVSDILILNLPDLGAVPAIHGNPIATRISNDFNSSLAKEISSFQDAYSDINVYGLDILGFFQAIINNPDKYGFTDVTSPSPNFTDEDDLTWDSDGHAFWDEIHPTTEAHIQIAKQAVFALDGTSDFPIPYVPTYVPPVDSGGDGGGCFIDSLFSYK